MTEPTIHVHMLEECHVLSVRGAPDWAVLQVKSLETGELFRFGLKVNDLSKLADRLRQDAMLLKAE